MARRRRRAQVGAVVGEVECLVTALAAGVVVVVALGALVFVGAHGGAVVLLGCRVVVIVLNPLAPARHTLPGALGV
jgi:hypothetical protein